MAHEERVRTAFERNIKAVTLRPSIGQGTATTKVRVRSGLTCDIEDGRWQLTADMSEKSGGDGEGPDPGVFGRSALGTCLAVGYVMWAAKAGVPISSLEVEVQADYDVRGEYGVGDQVPGYVGLRYVVTVESSAPESDVRRVLDEADSHSPYLYLYRDPQDLRREVRIVASGS